MCFYEEKIEWLFSVICGKSSKLFSNSPGRKLLKFLLKFFGCEGIGFVISD